MRQTRPIKRHRCVYAVLLAVAWTATSALLATAQAPLIYPTAEISPPSRGAAVLNYGRSLGAWHNRIVIGSDGGTSVITLPGGTVVYSQLASGPSLGAVSGDDLFFGYGQPSDGTVFQSPWPQGQTGPSIPTVLGTGIRIKAIALHPDFAYVSNIANSPGSPLQIDIFVPSPIFPGSWIFLSHYEVSGCTLGGAMDVNDVGTLLLIGSSCNPTGSVTVRSPENLTLLHFTEEKTDTSFGASVAFSGSQDFVAGRPEHIKLGINQPAEERGSAYSYTKAGVSWQEKLIDFGTGVASKFGSAIDANETTLVIGAPMEDIGSPFALIDAGAAYVYRKCDSNWVRVAKLVAAFPQPSEFFGSSVAITETGILVGAPGNDSATVVDQGIVYYFDGLVPTMTACFEGGDLSEWSSTSP